MFFLLLHILPIAFDVRAWRFAGDGPEYPIKVGDAVEATVVRNGGDTFVPTVGEAFTRLIDADLVEEADECVEGMFLKVPAERLRGHVCLAGNVFKGDRFVELLHDIIVDGADPDAFVLAVGEGMCAIGEWCQFLEGAQEFEELDEVNELVDAGGMFDTQHFFRDLVYVLGRDLEPGLLVLEEGFYILDLGQIEKGIQLAFGVEENIKRSDLLSAGGHKIGGVAFEDVGQVDPQPVDLAAAKSVHVIFGYKRAFTLLDPGKLNLLMPVEVGIKMGKDVLLDDDCMVAGDGDGKLQYFHHDDFVGLCGVGEPVCEITPFADITSGQLISDKNRLKYGCPGDVPLPDGKKSHRRWWRDHWTKQRLLFTKSWTSG